MHNAMGLHAAQGENNKKHARSHRNVHNVPEPKGGRTKEGEAFKIKEQNMVRRIYMMNPSRSAAPSVRRDSIQWSYGDEGTRREERGRRGGRRGGEGEGMGPSPQWAREKRTQCMTHPYMAHTYCAKV